MALEARPVAPCPPPASAQPARQSLKLQSPPAAVQASVRYSLAKAPKLVDIIAAVPEEHKATLLPQWVLCLRSRL